MIEIWNPKRSSLWTGDWWIISVEFSSVTLIFRGATKFPMDLSFQICARWRWFKFLNLHHSNIYYVAKQALSTRKILKIQCIFFCDFVKKFKFNFGRNFFFNKKKNSVEPKCNVAYRSYTFYQNEGRAKKYIYIYIYLILFFSPTTSFSLLFN